MRASDIVAVAVDAGGRVYVAATTGVATIERGRLVPFSGAPDRVRIASIAPRPGGGLFVADAYANRVWTVTADARWEPLAGAPQPPSLDARARRVDGSASEALFRAPGPLVAWGTTLCCVEAGAVAVRVIANGRVTTVEPARSHLHALTAASAAPDGSLYVADGATPVPCLFRLHTDGRLERVSGDPDEMGDDDGDGARARFARIGALAAAPGGCYVADGSRIRFVADDASVTTTAGAEPGFRDGAAAEARFGAVDALAVGPDGGLVVADHENAAVRRMDAAGNVSTLVRDTAAKAFAEALVAGDITGAWVIAEALLAEHARRGATRPDRELHPVSAASARLGRALALEWCASDEPRRARLGAYCLWLVRADEGPKAPAEDAAQLAGAVTTALDRGDVDAARAAVKVVRIAFGDLARRRDRLAVAGAYREAGAGRAASELLGAAEPAARALGVDLVEQSRDVRFTPALAAIALDGGALGTRALGALRAIWEMPCYTREQAAELRAGLRFGRTAIDRLLATHGDTALGPHGTRRYFDLIS